jgi:HSP20 family protein
MEEPIMSNFLDLFRESRDVKDPFAAAQQAFDQMMSDWRGGRLGAPVFGAGFSPTLDVRETDKGVEVTAELPGVDEKDINLEIYDDILSLKGEKKVEKEEKDEKSGMVMRERSFGSFSRSIRLPYAPDPGKVEAKFDKGVLTITAARPKEVTQRTKRIKIG